MDQGNQVVATDHVDIEEDITAVRVSGERQGMSGMDGQCQASGARMLGAAASRLLPE